MGKDTRKGFASAVASTDAKRNKTPKSRDGGIDEGFLHARKSAKSGMCAAGVKPKA